MKGEQEQTRGANLNTPSSEPDAGHPQMPGSGVPRVEVVALLNTTKHSLVPVHEALRLKHKVAFKHTVCV